jgi:hypothetical protein
MFSIFSLFLSPDLHNYAFTHMLFFQAYWTILK